MASTRKNARWSNGDALTADDFVWSWQRALLPSLGNQYAYMYYPIKNAEALLSNGFDQINKKKFNIVVSNIPAKVGNEMLSLFLLDAFKQMKHGGKIYVVTITGLRKYIKRNFIEVFGNYKKLKQGPNYTVAMATKE